MVEKQPVYQEKQLIFMPDDEEMYIPAEVTETFERGQKGRARGIGFGNVDKVIEKDNSLLVERMDVQSYRDVEDMITLKLLNDAALLHNLRMRYRPDFGNNKMTIYTNIGSILVSINPYKDLGLYNADMEQKYLESGGVLQDLQPHIFKVAETAFYTMKHEDKDQSCVITGESGAGKTEATKRFLQYIAEKSRRNRESYGAESGIDSQLLRQQILDSNPFMEAFGNAKTLRNDNSSRFGKLIEMYFETSKGVVIGAKITNYLLEKSRVVKVQEGERNYHIFYQLCAAAASTHPQFKKKLSLQTADMFNYALGGNKKLSDLDVPDMTDHMVFAETVEAMKKLGMSEQELDTTWRICAGILHFGNVEFTGKDFAELKPGVQETSLQIAADLLGVDAFGLEQACIKRQLTNNIEKHHTPGEAEAARDALAKHLYDKLFDWLISKMNLALSQHIAQSSGNIRVLGVLDIFGFETFAVNSFEQMCINFCNEKLQAFFNDHVFKREQKIYEEEGIDAATVGFYDNQGVVDLIEKGPNSIMTICDDQCWLESATDENFLKKLLQNAKNVTDKDASDFYLFKPKIQDIRKFKHLATAFTIKHFAGMVHYNVESFLDKNKDQLRPDLRKLVSKSNVELLAGMFPNDGEGQAGRGAQFRKTLGGKFKDSLNRLMDKLNHTTPQFVRTIKPNDEKIPGKFDSHKVFRQLREAGLLEVCKIRKMGYPIRKKHRQFMNEYLCLDKSAKDVKDLCEKLKAKGILHGKKSPNWQVGKTQVFMRAEQADELETLRGEALKSVLKIIHTAARKFLFRSRVKHALVAIKDIKAGHRKRDPELLMSGLSFFIEKGPLYESLPIVKKGLEMMKELKGQVELLEELKAAVEKNDISTMKVKIDVAHSMGIGSHDLVKRAEELLEKLETEKAVLQKLDKAIGSQNLDQLREAIEFAISSKFEEHKMTKQAQTMLATLSEREKLLKALEKALKDNDLDAIAELVEKLRDLGCPDDHPLIMQAVRSGEMILEQNKKRDQRVATLEKQLRKNIQKKDLKKLRDLVAAAIGLKYNGPLITEAVELIQGLEQRNELIEEVVKAARVLREKSKLPDGVTEKDLAPLLHAIKQAEAVQGLDLGSEVQVLDGKKLVKQIHEQIVVQEDIAQTLRVEVATNDKNMYEVLEKIQRLGLQTREADALCQRVREHEMLKAKADALTNDQVAETLRLELRVPTKEERERHLLARIDQMYQKDSDFKKRARDAAKNRDLTLAKYYKVRSDADFVAREQKELKKERAQLKHAYIGSNPLSKSMLEMDEQQERKALQISQMIIKFCDALSGNKKESMESAMSFIVELGICDVVLADEIYMQLAKHLTANPNALSKNKAWYLFTLCATYFGCSARFEPYLLHYLQNSVNDAGLEGNYARYTLAQLSSSMVIDAREVKFKPGSGEIKAFFDRPPVLAQLELVDGTIEDIPIPPDFRLSDAAAIIRRRTKIMVTLEDSEWAVYIRATTRPPKLGYKGRLENFYRRYKPENLANVDSILKYHEGNEEALFSELVEISNYGPEPTPVLVGPKKKVNQSSRSLRSQSKAGGGGKAGDAYDDFLDDEGQSQYSSASKSSVGSAISKVGSVVSRMFRRARGLSTTNIQDLDVPNPTIPWPLPAWCHLGDVMHSLYEQDKIPVLTYKRRYCKTKGKPDENLFLQLQREFLEGTLVPYTESEIARLSVMILAVRLLKAGKELPYGDKAKLMKLGLLRCIPKNLRRANKKNEEWLDAYTDTCADKSLMLRDLGTDVKKLEKAFFEECVNFPTYGMSFFFAQILKGSIRSYMAKAMTDDDEGAVKIGINQKEISFFSNGKKVDSFALEDVTKYWCDGTTFTMKVKKTGKTKKSKNEGEVYDVALRENNMLGSSKRSNSRRFDFSVGAGGKGAAGTLRGFFSGLLGGKTETVQMYTLQPRELYDLMYFFKKVGSNN